MDINFILSYFVAKDLCMITAFVCWAPEEVSRLWRLASGAGVKLSVHSDLSRPRATAPYGMFREGMLLDLDCPGAELVLKAASASRGLNYRHSWLLVHNSSYDRNVVADTLGPYAILPDADVVWSSPDNLVDVYRIKMDQPYMLTAFGLSRNCSSLEHFKALWSVLPIAVARRRNLQGVSLVVCAVITQPQSFTTWSDVRNRDNDIFPKLTYPLVQLTAQDFNYRINMMQVDVYGVRRNGSFDGLTGVLERGERGAEIGLASMFIRADRSEVVHYITETVTLIGKFVFQQPPRSAVSNVFALPFGGWVWACMGGLASAAALQLAALSRAAARLPRAHPHLAQLTLPESLTFALGSLCQQGLHVTPPVTSVRVVMFCTLLMSLFAFTAYSAKVVAILQTPSDAIKSLEDLTRSPMTLGVQETTYKTTYYAESTYTPTRELYRRKLLPQGERAYVTIREGIDKVRSGFYAFQMEASAGYDRIKRTFTEREKCNLKEIEAFKLPKVAIPLKKHSGYRELFGTRMRWQREVGLLEQAKRHWVSERPRCETSGGGFVSIGLADVWPVIKMLGVGAMLTTLVLLVEVAVCRVGRLRRGRRLPLRH